jgi:AraC-like DNA-binding protein
VSFVGEGEVRIGDRWCPCPAGSAYVVPAGAPSGFRARGEDTWKVCRLTYRLPLDDSPLAEMTRPALLAADVGPIRCAIAGLQRETSVAPAEGGIDAVVLRYWADLIQLLAARITRDVRRGRGGQLGAAWEQVNADLAFRWTVADLADIIRVSEEHFRRLCQESVGMTPMDYVTRLRMRRAALLLSTSAGKIDRIAQQVGYADRYGFSVAFRRFFGVSPAQYRREPSRSWRTQ